MQSPTTMVAKTDAKVTTRSGGLNHPGRVAVVQRRVDVSISLVTFVPSFVTFVIVGG